MADILTLDDFRRNDAGRAKIPASKKYELHARISWQSPFVTLPDPLPKDWGEFWKATDLWWQQQAIAARPLPESWRWI